MTDIFFSYSRDDSERIRPIHDVLSAQGLDVFWDEQIAPGRDWDTWIKEKLTAAKCAIVFWSASSVKSKNVRHEAQIAAELGKLVPIMLDQLSANEFPMGLYTVEAGNLVGWDKQWDHPEWRNVLAQIEHLSTPTWLRRRLSTSEDRRKTALQEKRGLEVELSESRKALDDQTDALAKATERLETFTRDLARAQRKEAESRTAHAEAEERAVRADDKITQLERQIVALNAKVGQFTAPEMVAKRVATEDELDKLRSEGEARQEEIGRLKAQLVERDKKLATLEKNQADLHQAQSERSQEIEALRSAHATALTEKDRQIEKLTSEVKALSSNVVDAKFPANEARWTRGITFFGAFVERPRQRGPIAALLPFSKLMLVALVAVLVALLFLPNVRPIDIITVGIAAAGTIVVVTLPATLVGRWFLFGNSTHLGLGPLIVTARLIYARSRILRFLGLVIGWTLLLVALAAITPYAYFYLVNCALFGTDYCDMSYVYSDADRIREETLIGALIAGPFLAMLMEIVSFAALRIRIYRQ